ncbi:MAG: MFS transporter [Clostridiales bacterium]|nr:MFS transporter [Clostridiales bacterium]
MKEQRENFWSTPLTRSFIRSEDVKPPEMLIGYLIGPFGAMLSSGIFTSFLNKYFTDVLQLDTSFLSVLQVISTILIVAANLIVGQLIERTRCLAGKARPWVLLSALTMSVASLLMFIVPFESGTAKMVWIAIAYNLYYAVAYPIYNTANSTLIPVSTRNSQQRGTLASFTNIAGLGVMGVGSMIFPILVSNVMGNDQNMWFLVMLAIAIFSALTIFLQYKFTRERVTEESMVSGATEQNAAPPLGQQLKAVTGEKWWWVVILFYTVFQWAGGMKNGSMSYFCQWVIDATPLGGDWGVAQTLLSVMGAIPMAVAAVFVVPLANKFGKRNLCCIGMALGAVGGVIAGLGGSNIVPVAIGVALKCLGSSPACYLILAMLADVIDHIEFKSGIRTDGLTMSIYSSLMVASTPIMNAVFMAMLGSGYDAAAAAQTAAVQSTISVSYIWVETAAYVIDAILVLFFTVEKNLSAEQAEIQKRRQGAKETL